MTEALILAGTGLAATALLCATFLRAWRGWLDLRHRQVVQPAVAEGGDEVGLRIQLADVRERLKKLEAIASGVEL